MKVLVLFPGKTDEATYGSIVAALDDLGINYSLRLGSAHKSPDLVQQIISEHYDLVISGAGLAAHLPGTIAAKKLVPVLGVPCPGAYDSLDAFLSIVQMPPGIPVLEVSKDNAAVEAKKILEVGKNNKISIVGEGKAADNAISTLDEMGLSFEMGKISKDAVNIVFTDLGKPVEKRSELIIYCPVGKSRASQAIDAMNASEFGTWVGVNRGENAAIAAAQILGHKEKVSDLRKKYADKIIESDKEVRK